MKIARHATKMQSLPTIQQLLPIFALFRIWSQANVIPLPVIFNAWTINDASIQIPCKQLPKPSDIRKLVETFPPEDFSKHSPRGEHAVLILDYGPAPKTSLYSIVDSSSAYPMLLYMEKLAQTRSRTMTAVEVCAYHPPRVPLGEKHRIAVLVYTHNAVNSGSADANHINYLSGLCPPEFRTPINQSGIATLARDADFHFAAGAHGAWKLISSNLFVVSGDDACTTKGDNLDVPGHRAVVAPAWSYLGDTGPLNWPNIQPNCGGKRQSPINIVKSRVVLNDTLGNLTLLGYDVTLTQPWKIIKQGPTAHIVTQFPAGSVPSLKNGGLAKQGYVLQQLHFHWGDDEHPGAEHLIDNRRLPAELHIVHMRSDYAAVGGDAYRQDDAGLAVLGVLLDVGENHNKAYELLIQKLLVAEQYGLNASVIGLTLKSLLPNGGATREDLAFYRYAGSLTTPDCHEAVQWTLLQRPVQVSERQAEQLQKLLAPVPYIYTFPKAKNYLGGHHDGKEEEDEEFEDTAQSFRLGQYYCQAQNYIIERGKR